MRSRPRQLVVLFVFCCFLATPGILHGQEDAPAEAIPAAADPAQTTGNSPAWRDVSVRTLPTNYLSDQKDLWLFPGQVAQGRHWLPTVAVAGATAGLLAAEAHDELPGIQSRIQRKGHVTRDRSCTRCVLHDRPCAERLLRTENGPVCGRSRGRQFGPLRGDQRGEPEAAAFGDCSAEAIFRYLFSQPQGRFWQQLPFRAHRGGVLGGNSFRTALSRASLGPVGRLRDGRSDWLLTDYVAVPFSRGCIRGRRPGVLDQPFRRSARNVSVHPRQRTPLHVGPA